jgi:hypothetical protein
LWDNIETKSGRLLRLLFLRFSALPADAGYEAMLYEPYGLTGCRPTHSDGVDSRVHSPNRFSAARRDWASGRSFLLVWGLPGGALLLSAVFNAPYLVVAWPVLLTGMGVACLLNAHRCARTHCYVSGPFFLLLAVAALLYGLGMLPLGANGWRAAVAVLLVGGTLLIYAPDHLFGRYRIASSDAGCPDETAKL